MHPTTVQFLYNILIAQTYCQATELGSEDWYKRAKAPQHPVNPALFGSVYTNKSDNKGGLLCQHCGFFV